MNSDLKNMEMLFGDIDEDVYKALSEKQNWINGIFFIKGHINASLDEKGRVHYPLIEALIDEVLLFEEIKLDDKRCEIWNEQYRVLELSYGMEKDAPYAIVLDFNKLDKHGYNLLMPNFFRTVGEDCGEKGTDDITDLVRILMSREIGKAFIIIEKENLIRDAFFAPILVKLVAFPTASDELKEELQQIAHEKEIIYEEAKERVKN